jgi:hypothetical protein
LEIAHGFFKSRRPIKLSPIRQAGGIIRNYADYINVPPTIGMLISKKVATLNELSTVYGVENMYDMLEIVMVDDHNTALANQE